MKVFPDGRVRYAIRYPRWAGYAVALSAALGIILMAFFLTFDLRRYIASHAASRIPGLTLDQNVAIAWAMAVFWGFAWPWILIPLHKRPLRRLMEQIIGEVDAAASEARPRV